MLEFLSVLASELIGFTVVITTYNVKVSHCYLYDIKGVTFCHEETSKSNLTCNPYIYTK